MKPSLILFHQDALEKFPYLHYIYDAIIDHYAPLGPCKVIGFQDAGFQKIAAAGKEMALILIELPEQGSIKKGLWERINYPALVRQLRPGHIFYIGSQLPVLKDPKGAKQWCFVPDARQVQIADGAKAAVVRKKRQLHAVLQLADRIVTYSPTAVAAALEQLPSAGGKLLSWPPLPHNRYLDTALYTDALLDDFKLQNTSEASYFLADARIAREAELIEYLKAFSQFKKWQRSSMQLAILLSAPMRENKGFLEKFDAYFYKEDVHLLGALDKQELYMWIRGAYAVITPDTADQGLDIQLAAAGLGTLMIAPDSPAASLLPGARFDLASVNKETLGQVLIASYKSELLRTRHIHAGFEAFENWRTYARAEID